MTVFLEFSNNLYDILSVVYGSIRTMEQNLFLVIEKNVIYENKYKVIRKEINSIESIRNYLLTIDKRIFYFLNNAYNNKKSNINYKNLSSVINFGNYDEEEMFINIMEIKKIKDYLNNITDILKILISLKPDNKKYNINKLPYDIIHERYIEKILYIENNITKITNISGEILEDLSDVLYTIIMEEYEELIIHIWGNESNHNNICQPPLHILELFDDLDIYNSSEINKLFNKYFSNI